MSHPVIDIIVYDGLYPREEERLLDAYDLHVHFMYVLGTKRNIISWLKLHVLYD